MKAFIAHAVRDRPFVAGLATLLREGGDQVVIPAEMEPGEDTLAEISAAIRSADILIAVLTAGNPNLFYEIGLAAGAGVPTLIVASARELLPAGLSSTPYVQLSGDAVRDAHVISRRVEELRSISPTRLMTFESAAKTLQKANRDPSLLESISPTDFERLVVELLKGRGYAVTTGDATRGREEFVIETKRERVLVEVKKTSRQSRVSVETVRRFLSRVYSTGTRGMLVATSEFTAAGLELAVGSPVALRTLEQVLAARTQDELLETDSQNSASSIANLAAAWARRGDTDKAIQYYERAGAILRDSGDPGARAAAYAGTATAWARKGDVDKAIECYERAIAILLDIDDRRGQAAVYAGMAAAWGRKGDSDQTIEYYEKAAAILQDMGDDGGQATAYARIAAAWARKGDSNKAIEYYEKAATIQRKLADRFHLAISLAGTAAAFAKLGTLEAAITYYRQAAALQREVGDRYHLAASLAGTAAVWLRIGRFETAMEHYQQAAAIQRELADRYHLSRTLHGLANAAAHAGKTQVAESCRQELERLGLGKS